LVESNIHLNKVCRDSDILEDRDKYICLDMNERVSAFCEPNFQDMLKFITPTMFSSYPNVGPLYKKLEKYTGLGTECLCLGAGSDSLIRRAFQAYLSPNDRLVTPEPTYGMYNVWARIFEAAHDILEYSADLTLDIDQFISLIGDDARIVAIANPDQPTGYSVSCEDIKRIAKKTVGSNSLLLVDEAYFPFGSESAKELLADYSHLLIIRSFSKSGGLAGLRVGYAMASPQIIKALHAVRSPGEVNAVGACVAGYLLDNPEIMKQFSSAVRDGRSVLTKAAAKLGFGVPKCEGNFQLLRVPLEISPDELARALKQQNYLIKYGFKHSTLKQCVRVTLDGPEIMDKFVKTLSSTVNKLLSSRKATLSNKHI